MYTKTKQGTTIFYDSVTQEPLFEAPIGEKICFRGCVNCLIFLGEVAKST